jgi:glycosyltransferase involved in cell wall biosynthesis
MPTRTFHKAIRETEEGIVAIALKQVQPKVIAAIPAYNEEKFIAEVVENALQYVDEVIVVDDGSTDRTAEAAENAGALVVRHEVNKRYGGAIKTCFEFARQMDIEVLVTIDGDGQHDASDIPLALAPIKAGQADIVIGSRFMDKENHVPLYRKFGIGVITLLFNIGCKTKVSDAQSGFRAYSWKAIQAIGNLKDDDMAISVELLIKARRKNLKVVEIPISVKYHAESSTQNPVKHGLSVALATVQYRLSL